MICLKLEEIFTSFAGGECFSKLDLKDAYLQMVMSDESKWLLTINTQKGLLHYNRLVFGVASAPALWQRAMDQVLQGLKGCHCMLYDMIVRGVTRDEHLCNLRAVLNRLKQYILWLNRQKYDFF